MRKKRSIIWRWMWSSFSLIVALVLILGLAFLLAIRSYFYSGVEYALLSRLDSLDSYIQQVAYANADYLNFSSLSYDLMEGFEEKDKLEMQVLDADGRAVVSSTGFPPSGSVIPEYAQAYGNTATNRASAWTGRSSAGEHIMAATLVVRDTAGNAVGGVRYVTSLTRVDRQVWSMVGLVAVIGVCVMFFVVLSSSYFIGSIVRPVSEINRTARQIALGDYNARIEKTTDDEIGELCDTINYMAGEIAAAERVKNDFVSSVSHELRTPLTAIKGWAETLRGGGLSDEELTAKGLDVIMAESERLSGIVEDLLDFSRMQGGRLTMKFGKTDILAELSEAVELFRDRAEREGIDLLFIEPEALPPVLGDAERLRQVFINILDNAIKYSNRGDRIRIETAEMGNNIQIVISDTGVGIAAEDLPNVKSKFYKANKTRPGSGIGLALVDEILSRHKGRMDIDSEEGVGTTVTLMLPMATVDSEDYSPAGE